MHEGNRTEISTLGEFGLIKHLTQDIKLQNPETKYGVGDDAAVLEFPGKQVLVTTDLLMEGVHVAHDTIVGNGCIIGNQTKMAGEVIIDDNAIVLTARSGRAALKHRLSVLGVEMEGERLDVTYQEFLKLADKKKEVNDDDILMLAGADRAAAHAVKLDYLQVTTGMGVKSVACIGLDIAGEKFEASASGNGPVDAAISALKNIIKRQMVLKEFTIQAISKGSDDVGKVHMQVEYDGHVYYGFGANTDIVTASVEAYIDCINKFKK